MSENYHRSTAGTQCRETILTVTIVARMSTASQTRRTDGRTLSDPQRAGRGGEAFRLQNPRTRNRKDLRESSTETTRISHISTSSTHKPREPEGRPFSKIRVYVHVLVLTELPSAAGGLVAMPSRRELGG